LLLGDPNVTLGQYTFITEWLLNLFKADLNAKVKLALEEAIDPSMLVVAIPEDIRKFNPTTKSEAFGTDSGQPALLVHLQADHRVGRRPLSSSMLNSYRCPAYSPDFMPVGALWRWLREDVADHRGARLSKYLLALEVTICLKKRPFPETHGNSSFVFFGYL
jgi:hypothetical protein